MQNYDTNILIQNIKRLMRDKNVSQQKLAEILEMSQPNVSKALNEKDKKCFTLIQVIGIAEYFHISVDELVHNKKSAHISTSQRSVAQFIALLFESGVQFLHLFILFLHCFALFFHKKLQDLIAILYV